jgi:uncharacterized integral membrane protein
MYSLLAFTSRVCRRIIPHRFLIKHRKKSYDKSASSLPHSIRHNQQQQHIVLKLVHQCRVSLCHTQINLCMLYVLSILVGVYVYQRAIVFSYGGSSFGQQLACVAASSALLSCAAILGNKISQFLVCCNENIQESQQQKQQQTKCDDDDNDDYNEEQHSLINSSNQSNTSPKSRHENAPNYHFSWLQIMIRCIFILFPILLPSIWTIHAFLYPSDHSTAMSAQVNVILFSSISAAMMCCIAFVYLCCHFVSNQKIKQFVLINILIVLLCIVVAMYNYHTSQTAYLRGLNIPMILSDPQLKLPSTIAEAQNYDVLLHNPHIKQMIQYNNKLAGIPDDDLQLSLLDSATELMIRHNQTACIIPPHLHLAELLPRRSVNFFTGSESCSTMSQQHQFSHLETHMDESNQTMQNNILYIDNCPLNDELSFNGNPDYITQRSMEQSDVTRHKREFFDQELEELKLTDQELHQQRNVLISNRLSSKLQFNTGQYSFFSVKCG